MTTLGAHLRAALAADDVAAVRSLVSDLSRSPQDDAAHGVDAALRLAAWARLLVRDAPTGHADGAVGEASVLDADVRRTRQDEAELSAVEDKSEGLRLGAQTFQRHSTELKNVLWWRNFKIKAIVAIVVLVVVGYIVIPIFVKQ